MSQLTFVLGKTGTGKSTSLRHFTKKDGMLFGARVEMMKFGKFEEKPV